MDITFYEEENCLRLKKKNSVYEGEGITAVDEGKRSQLKKDIDMVFELEDIDKPDFVHHRNSGMNQVIAKILAEKDIIAGFSFNLLLRKDTARMIGRMRQNVIFCRKYGIRMVFGSFARNRNEKRNMEDLKSFARTIGMNPGEIKSSMDVLEERAAYNKKKKEGKVFKDIAEKIK